MQIAKLRVKSLADDLAVTHDYRANQRVWAYFSTPALRKLKSPPQLLTIRGCKRGIHVD
jgi:hypothetical protein